MPFNIAIDFDGTLFTDNFPETGAPRRDIIDKTKKFREHGAEVFLWTCREGKVLEEAIELCKQQGLEFDAINENNPTTAKWLKEKADKGEVLALRKPLADIYVDDKSPGSIEYYLSIDVEKTCKNFENR